MKFVWLVSLLYLVITPSQPNPAINRYAGYKFLRMYPTSPHHIQVLRQLETRSKRQAEVWRESNSDGNNLDMLISPEMADIVRMICDEFGISYEELSSDVMASLQREHDHAYNGDHTFKTNKYHTYQEIVNWMDNLHEECPQLATVFDVAISWQGRAVKAVKLSSSRDENTKPVIWMDAGIHANEWIGPATLIYFIDKLCTGYGANNELTLLLDRFDIYIVPLLNVDGYVYTWEYDRLWRKTRSVHGNSSCVGVDMNRNWNIMWSAHRGHDSSPCGRMYPGPRPFSEPELQGVLESLQQLQGRLVGYLAYHSYSQLWLLPYGFSRTSHPSNYASMLNASQHIVDAIKSVHGTRYLYGTVSDLVGQTAGASIDYVSEVLHTPYSFGVELRDRGTYGMILPSSEIIANSEESLVGVIALGDWISSMNERS